ncbi:hypothetical protein [Streptomyces canus]|uniref:hypothetical protein n=1 Tax=Streptomyces canus TaxID=58343 RepID=UPI0027D88E8F|nr:hypothetical protein [Streptomyces canus]
MAHTDPAGIRTWLRDRLDHGWELLPLLAALITPQQFPFLLIDNETWAGLDAMSTHDDLYTRLTPSSTTACPAQAPRPLCSAWRPKAVSNIFL